MNKFYFNTGVKPWYSPKLNEGEVFINNEKHISFEADAPVNAQLMFLCDNPELPESKSNNVLVKEVFNTTMCSKFAYFRL